MYEYWPTVDQFDAMLCVLKIKQLDIIMIELCGDQTVHVQAPNMHCTSSNLWIKRLCHHQPHHHDHHRHDNHHHHCCDFVLDPPAFVRQQLPGKTAPPHQVVVVVEVVVAHQVVEVVEDCPTTTTHLPLPKLPAHLQTLPSVGLQRGFPCFVLPKV